MEEWAATYGVQRAEGLQLTPTYSASNNNDDDDLQNQDMSVMTTQDLPASSPVLSVPAGMVLYSLTAQQEFSPMPDVDDLFEKVYGQHRLPYFYLFVKVLAEYQAGDQSPWYPWLNSLPRIFANGACLTFFCFECLPPLVRRLALQERTRFSQFFRALKYVPFLSDEIKNNRKLAKWAFAVVFTRSLEVGPGDVRIVPMADMFNHGSDTEVDLSFDGQGNSLAYTKYDVPAGYPLRVSYTNGDNTNPSNLFATYGFLDESSLATFCKIWISSPSEELVNMGYDHSRMLFYKDTGDVSEEVWDVLLYQNLGAQAKSNPEMLQVQQAFYQAHMNGDYETKQAIHNQYFAETSAALRDHVDSFLEKLDSLSAKAEGKNISDHPRLPLILRHNEFVKETFLAVRAKQWP